MILKYTVKIMLLLALFYGLWYSYEFINPWIAIIAGILITAFFIDKLINKINK